MDLLDCLEIRLPNCFQISFITLKIWLISNLIIIRLMFNDLLSNDRAWSNEVMVTLTSVNQANVQKWHFFLRSTVNVFVNSNPVFLVRLHFCIFRWFYVKNYHP